MAAIDTIDLSLPERLSRDLDAAFAEVVADFEATVFTTALRVSGRSDQAEDLAAETFLRAYAALRRYSPERIEELQLRPWLLTICLNLWRNQLRTASRRPAETAPSSTWQDPPAPGESPEAQAERHDQSARLAVALAHLPDNQRAAVVLRHIVGLSYAEMAEVLRCPESTAKSHVRRGLDGLRSHLLNHPEVCS